MASTPTSSPTAYGPPGATGVDRWAPGGQNQRPTPANPESARVIERASGEAGWQGGLGEAFSRSASAAGRP
eukprot:6801584-Alexandrium_andersonii.AAC.1